MQSERWAVWFSVEGDARFLSHRNMMSLCERAAARARLPIRFSEGFNPRPRLSLAVPRPVGVASRCELLIMEFARGLGDERWARHLAEQFTRGVKLLRVEQLPDRCKVRVKSATYELSPEAPAETSECLSALMRLEKWQAPRRGDHAGNRTDASGATVDIRPRVGGISVDAGRLVFTLTAGPAGLPGPRAVLGLLDLDDAEVLAGLIRTNLECEF